MSLSSLFETLLAVYNSPAGVTLDSNNNNKDMSSMKLSRNFSVQEFIESNTAKSEGIDNTMPKKALENAMHLTQNVLQPVRDHFGLTRITSGYRSPKLNKAVGGSDTSDHLTGSAADIKVDDPDISNKELAEWIYDNLEFNQLILEFYDDDEGGNSGWVHVSYLTEGNENEYLIAYKDNQGNTQYKYGR